MRSSVFANLESKEGTVTTSTTITFDRRVRLLTITNDSLANDLGFKFNSSETAATLKPSETITLEVSTKTLYLTSTSADYRVWGYS